MTRDEIAESIRGMRRYKREVTASKEAAIDALKRAGILTKTGRVASPYKDLLSGKKAGLLTKTSRAA
ncbi:hypothetical protein [Candidatus Thiosymbion oneisti]|uniref:hypothetical protein n=1 Tax=Candidatus Thiosymbion oneisti TaxID=589554 RepID=UPI0014152133|nr:hypothetical protein [Candidatus Thiosymbion oneisti]